MPDPIRYTPHEAVCCQIWEEATRISAEHPERHYSTWDATVHMLVDAMNEAQGTGHQEAAKMFCDATYLALAIRDPERVWPEAMAWTDAEVNDLTDAQCDDLALSYDGLAGLVRMAYYAGQGSVRFALATEQRRVQLLQQRNEQQRRAINALNERLLAYEPNLSGMSLCHE